MKKVFYSTIIGLTMAMVIPAQGSAAIDGDAQVIAEAYANTKGMPEEEGSWDVPEWLKRVDFTVHGLVHGTDSKPTFTLETIQPIYQTADTLRHTFFYQLRMARHINDETYNVGLGYRFLFPEEMCILGVNSFFDVTGKHNHKRWSVGGEVIGKYLTVRGNYYKAISALKTVSSDAGVNTTERALNGRDIEGEIPVPYLPWMRFLGSYYYWEGDVVKDMEGHRAAIEMNITDNISIEIGSSHDNFDSNNYGKVTFTVGRPMSKEYTLFKDKVKTKTVFAERNLKNQTLAKVRRNNAIVVETRTTGGAGLIVSRGA